MSNWDRMSYSAFKTIFAYNLNSEYNYENEEIYNKYRVYVDGINVCKRCNKTLNKTESVFCHSCENSKIKCYNCNNLIFEEHAKIYKHKKYCQSCYNELFFVCRNCNCVESVSKKYHAFSNNYCKQCYDRKFFKCKICENIMSVERKSEDGNYCIDCHPKDFVLRYNYKPKVYNFKTTRKTDKVFMGVELEITGASDNNDLIDVVKHFKNYNDFYFKSDGSIEGYGFEVVSHPYTLNYHKDKAAWKNLFEMLNSKGINKTNNCGLHVHFPKDIFTPQSIGALDCFVNINMELISRFGGRDFNDYCSNTIKKVSNWGINSGNRYMAVNLSNEKTVELRFCKSTGNYEEFMKKLQFLHSIVKFMLKCNITAQDIYDYRKKIENKYITFAKNNYDFMN